MIVCIYLNLQIILKNQTFFQPGVDVLFNLHCVYMQYNI